MPLTVDTMNEIFADTANDMDLIITQCKEAFYRPEVDRETVKMWIEMPLVLKEAITSKNPKLASSLDKKAEEYKKGVNYGIS